VSIQISDRKKILKIQGNHNGTEQKNIYQTSKVSKAQKLKLKQIKHDSLSHRTKQNTYDTTPETQTFDRSKTNTTLD
jgi:hypothetical protein